jgi:hypothetical protein
LARFWSAWKYRRRRPGWLCGLPPKPGAEDLKKALGIFFDVGPLKFLIGLGRPKRWAPLPSSF